MPAQVPGGGGDRAVRNAQQHDVRVADRLAAPGRAEHLDPRFAERAREDDTEASAADDGDGRGGMGGGAEGAHGGGARSSAS
ncbi:hypothetical protein GCM10023351_15950 [Microbacterium gilvum]|uniref:Uncharacterized protein n=1 Tax=Microbacterium gilvum TaxID=1336204 RepID=A0ABP9A2C0_9MICO